MHETQQRKFFSIIDGIIGGEGDGPIITKAKPCGVLVGGFNPLAVDICTTRLMGFDYHKFAQFEHALKLKKYSLMTCTPDEIICMSNHQAWRDILQKQDDLLHFEPATGWTGKIEI
jgi:uncharacterized protein (DUF362 family)